MSRLAATSRLGSEFDAFLFAPIGEDRNGLSLSVLSALARMDLDPWQEAATLAALPAAKAVQKVAALFGALPDESLSDLDRDRSKMATRLIALLPRPPNSASKSRLASQCRFRSGSSMELHAMNANTLTPEMLRRMDAYWRAANYLAVGQIYLYDNPLRETLPPNPWYAPCIARLL